MNITWKNCIRICVSVFVLYLCMEYFGVLMSFLGVVIGAAAPLGVGCVIAYCVNILMSFYEKHYFSNSKNKYLIKSRRPVCMVGAFLSLIAIITLVVNLVVPQLISCIQLIIAKLPLAIGYILNIVDGWGIVSEDVTKTLAGIDWQSRITEIVSMLTSSVGSVAKVVINVFSGIVTSFIGIIFSFYVLLSKDRLKRQFSLLMDTYLPCKVIGKVKYVAKTVDNCFKKYISGQCIEAVILGSLCTVGMLILQLPYAAMIGALVAFTALIPVAGAYIGAGVGAFMILTVSPVKALIFLVFLIVLQQVEGNLIYPKVVGSSIGLPAIWVLAAITVGGGIMGILGMLLGVPVAASVYKLISDSVKKEKMNA
ncbi:MAG: AI-2E family transporter [Clostridia bacterium]|nr:AI-2E family transporter [Clostridia bacterium]